MAKPASGSAPRKSGSARPVVHHHAGLPPVAGLSSVCVLALRKLERVHGAMGVMTVALEHAASPEFSNEGAALILRMLRQESAAALAALVSGSGPRDAGATAQ